MFLAFPFMLMLTIEWIGKMFNHKFDRKDFNNRLSFFFSGWIFLAVILFVPMFRDGIASDNFAAALDITLLFIAYGIVTDVALLLFYMAVSGVARELATSFRLMMLQAFKKTFQA